MKAIGERLLQLKLEYLDDIIYHLTQEEIGILFFELLKYGLVKKSTNYNKILSNIENIESVKWMIEQKRIINSPRIWLFGAGAFGLAAFQYIQEQNILGFIDNDEKKVGTVFCGKKIISLNDYRNERYQDTIVISTDVRTAYYIAKQLELNEIKNYLVLYDIIKGE